MTNKGKGRKWRKKSFGGTEFVLRLDEGFAPDYRLCTPTCGCDC